MWENRNENPHRQVRKKYSHPCQQKAEGREYRGYFVVPPRFRGLRPPFVRADGAEPGDFGAKRALYACSADVLHALHRRSLSANGSLSERRAALLLPRHGIFIFQLLSEWSFSCASSYDSQGHRAAIRGSAFPPKPDWSRRGRCKYRTDAACA